MSNSRGVGEAQGQGQGPSWGLEGKACHSRIPGPPQEACAVAWAQARRRWGQRSCFPRARHLRGLSHTSSRLGPEGTWTRALGGGVGGRPSGHRPVRSPARPLPSRPLVSRLLLPAPCPPLLVFKVGELSGTCCSHPGGGFRPLSAGRPQGLPCHPHCPWILLLEPSEVTGTAGLAEDGCSPGVQLGGALPWEVAPGGCAV